MLKIMENCGVESFITSTCHRHLIFLVPPPHQLSFMEAILIRFMGGLGYI